MNVEHFTALSGSVGDSANICGRSQACWYAVDATGAVVGAVVLVGVASILGAGLFTKIGAGVVGAVAGAITAEVLAGAPLP